jgi:formate dehydrogenase (hydrogenase)
MTADAIVVTLLTCGFMNCQLAYDMDTILTPTLDCCRRQLLVRKVCSMSKQVRLTEPLVRDNGRLRPASWEEALDRAAAGFAAARQRDATKSFGMFSCSKASNEMNYMAQKFTRAVMGSNNIDSCNRT